MQALRFLVLCSISTAVLLAACSVYQGVMRVDVEALSRYKYPSKEEWDLILHENRDVIQDGSTDLAFLNGCFAGGWKRCHQNFVRQNDPWKFSQVKSERPELLGGNMTDTDRVAGIAGWRSASNLIEANIDSSSERMVRSRLFVVNRMLLGALVLFSASILLAFFLRTI